MIIRIEGKEDEVVGVKENERILHINDVTRHGNRLRAAGVPKGGALFLLSETEAISVGEVPSHVVGFGVRVDAGVFEVMEALAPKDPPAEPPAVQVDVVADKKGRKRE